MILSASFLELHHLMVILCLLRCCKAPDSLQLALYNKHAPSGSIYSVAKGATNGGPSYSQVY